MFKRLPFLCTMLLTLAACSSPNNNSTVAAPAIKDHPSATTSTSASATSDATNNHTPATSASEKPSNAPASAAAPATKDDTATSSNNSKWVEGKNYFLIQPPQPPNSPGKIEVTEVFSYGCPACDAFHTVADKIAESLPNDAVMKYLPASFIPAENWPLLQRAYLTAQALGVAKKTHDAMFDAVWVTKQLSAEDPQTGGVKPADALPKLADVAKFYAKFGISPKEFEVTANSFAINTQMKRADELIQAYGVDETPTMVINGKYRFTVASAGGYAQTIELTKYLVAKEAAQH